MSSRGPSDRSIPTAWQRASKLTIPPRMRPTDDLSGHRSVRVYACFGMIATMSAPCQGRTRLGGSPPSPPPSLTSTATPECLVATSRTRVISHHPDLVKFSLKFLAERTTEYAQLEVAYGGPPTLAEFGRSGFEFRSVVRSRSQYCMDDVSASRQRSYNNDSQFVDARQCVDWDLAIQRRDGGRSPMPAGTATRCPKPITRRDDRTFVLDSTPWQAITGTIIGPRAVDRTFRECYLLSHQPFEGR
jgi:hypothetical protein